MSPFCKKNVTPWCRFLSIYETHGSSPRFIDCIDNVTFEECGQVMLGCLCEVMKAFRCSGGRCEHLNLWISFLFLDVQLALGHDFGAMVASRHTPSNTRPQTNKNDAAFGNSSKMGMFLISWEALFFFFLMIHLSIPSSTLYTHNLLLLKEFLK